MSFDENSLLLWITILWAIIGFLSGSLMFSYWIGRRVLHRDIREVGDGNPGATNLIKAGSIPLGIFALLLDALKGALPVAMAKYVLGLTGVPLVIVALAPIFLGSGERIDPPAATVAKA